MSKTISIIPPYVSDSDEIRLDIITDEIDVVERSGYISPDKKIQEFINSGTILQNYRTGGEEYDMQGSETENEPDSVEYVEELTQDAENYTEEPLPQFVDVLSAVEKVDNIEKQFRQSELATESEKKERTKAKKERTEFIEELSTSISSKTSTKEKSLENND